ncbi:hypothetical protein ACFXJ6_07980 [Streptomyces sp. NPDC059218]|uniref:hypothetical protein n=1 Tax=unclassified Streptomyces TaxID=2593676 RepID=UPI0036C1769A
MNSFETEFQTATKAVTAATAAASAHIGDLLRGRFPTVAALLVDTERAVVDSCYDSDGLPVDLLVGHDESELIDSVFEEVDNVLGQVLSLGATQDALLRNGWKMTHPRPYATFRVRTKTDDRT